MTNTQTARRLALVMAATVLMALLPFGSAIAQDTPEQDGEPDITLDLDAENNVEYSVIWARTTYPNTAIDAGNGPERAFIGRDDLFADNLASGALQDEGPLLLTPGDALAELTKNELERLGVERVTILGGEVAISAAVENELNDAGYEVDRLFGITRIETAIAIAEENQPNGGGDTDGDGDVDGDDDADAEGENVALVARGFEGDDPTTAFADSLAAGGWAAAEGYDVLLTQTDVLTENTANQIESGEYDRVIVIGGEAAVSADTMSSIEELNENVERVGGSNRFETAVLIANARGFEDSSDADVTILVDGQLQNAWADGFPAANLAGTQDYPIVLSNSAAPNLPEPTQEFLVEDGVDFAAHLTEVDVICGPSVPDGDPAGEPDQCGEAADETGTVVQEVPLDPDGPGPDPEDPFTVQACTGPLETFNEAPELVSVEIDEDEDDVVRFTFDEAVPGQALNFNLEDPADPASGRSFYNFRLYQADGSVDFPTEARIDDNDFTTVIARFDDADSVASASRAGVSYNAVEDETGVPSAKGHCALAPTEVGPGQGIGYLRLTECGNYRLGDVIVGGLQDVLVDFTFDGDPDSFAATDFYLIGNNSAVYQGQEIEDEDNDGVLAEDDGDGNFTVTVQFADDPTELPATEIARCIFAAGNTDGDADPAFDDYDTDEGPILAEPFEGTERQGNTADPDLLSVERVNEFDYRFVFDEPVSDQADEIDPALFVLFDSDGDTTAATAAARSAVAGDNASVIIASFPSLPDDPTDPDTPVGAYIASTERDTEPDEPNQAAARAADNTQSESDGYTRPDQVELDVDDVEDPDDIPAGITALPDLVDIVVDQNVVTQNFSVTYVFDQAIDTATAQTTVFELFDANGTVFEVRGADCGDEGVVCNDDANEITFSIDEEFAEFSNEDIQAAVSGGVETDNPEDENPQVTEGYFGTGDDDPNDLNPEDGDDA